MTKENSYNHAIFSKEDFDVLTVSRVMAVRDDRALFRNLSFTVQQGELLQVVGPNGAGKTTFIAQIMGDVRPDQGMINFAGQSLNGLSTAQRVRLGLARTFQIPRLLKEQSVIANVALAIQAAQGHSFRFWQAAAQDSSLIEPAHAILQQSGLSARAQARSADAVSGT